MAQRKVFSRRLLHRDFIYLNDVAVRRIKDQKMQAMQRLLPGKFLSFFLLPIFY